MHRRVASGLVTTETGEQTETARAVLSKEDVKKHVKKKKKVTSVPEPRLQFVSSLIFSFYDITIPVELKLLIISKQTSKQPLKTSRTEGHLARCLQPPILL